MRVLGISAYYHDSAAALLEDGRILAAVQEERLTRRKHDAAFPRRAIESCLEIAGLKLEDVDCIAFYDKPFLKFERLLETYVAFAPRGFRSFRMAIPVWLREKLFQKDLLLRELAALAPGLDCSGRLLFSEHHLSHAASAYYPSPFDEAVVLTADGVGEWTTTSVAIGRGERLDIVRELHFPHSLGLLYSAFTYYLGFRVNSGEYKVMGLAPYGEPRYRELILSRLMDLKADGTFRLDMRYFDYCTGLTMTNRRFDQLFGGPPRRSEAPIEQRHKDLAASIQSVIEEAMLRLTRALAAEFRLPDLCLAGGVALNCVANGRILRDGAFERLWVQPAAGDAGGALGAALVATTCTTAGRVPPSRRASATPCPARCSAPATATRRSRRDWPPPARVSSSSTRTRCWSAASTRWSRRPPSAGSRVAWSSARARWAAVPSWPTRAPPG
jgi:carbamoyltransferase